MVSSKHESSVNLASFFQLLGPLKNWPNSRLYTDSSPFNGKQISAVKSPEVGRELGGTTRSENIISERGPQQNPWRFEQSNLGLMLS